jgi:hypothetical protein
MCRVHRKILRVELIPLFFLTAWSQVSGLWDPLIRPGPDLRFSGTPDLIPDLTDCRELNLSHKTIAKGGHD